MPPFAELKNRVAIVTGAAQGIGRNTAVTLAHHGMPVVLADLNDDPRPASRRRNHKPPAAAPPTSTPTSERWPAANIWSKPP